MQDDFRKYTTEECTNARHGQECCFAAARVSQHECSSRNRVVTDAMSLVFPRQGSTFGSTHSLRTGHPRPTDIRDVSSCSACSLSSVRVASMICCTIRASQERLLWARKSGASTAATPSLCILIWSALASSRWANLTISTCRGEHFLITISSEKLLELTI
jgi:hypothetical protein